MGTGATVSGVASLADSPTLPLMRPIVLLVALAGLLTPTFAQVDAPVDTIVPAPPSARAAFDLFDALSLGAPDFQGELTDDDPIQDGKPYDAFSFEAESGHEVTVTMTADDFDTYLIVRSPTGQEWSNDDFGSTRVSQVTYTVVSPGTYTIWATAFSDSGRGAYEIHVSEVAATIVETVSGRLDYEDEQLIKGEYFDVLTLSPRVQQPFYVELMPLGFGGYMRVTSPSGVRQTAQTDYSGSRTIRVGPLQPESGRWTVEITTMGAEEVGAYDLHVVALDEQ